jgi:hypothetical protein
MANPQHLKILKQGVAAWNKWRAENPEVIPNLGGVGLSGAGLSGADYHGVKLRRANLIGADLTAANLTRADLRQAKVYRADLSGANLRNADLSSTELDETNLSGADLSRAALIAANLSGANLRKATLTGATLHMARFDKSDFTNAELAFTVFADNDLSTAKGLEKVNHRGPSTIGIDTIYNSKGNIPEVFLRGAGVPEDFIVYMRSLVGKAIDFYSCFISYSTKDDDFAQRLYADLQAKNVRCWKFDENAKWGEPVWGEIDTAIRHYDKLVVICSQRSLQSPAVIREIERALQKEDREHRNVLFPISVDDYLLKKWDHPRKADVVSKVIGDFRGGNDLAAYAKAFSRFLDALNRPQ